MKLHMNTEDIRVNGVDMRIDDVKGSAIRSSVLHDLSHDAYGFSKVPFSPGDIVVDIGANVGMISIYLAKRYFVTVIAYEPAPINFANLHRNVQQNWVGDRVLIHNKAVTCDGRDLPMIGHFESNTGGATGFLSNMDLPDHTKFVAKSTTLDSILSALWMTRPDPKKACKLLKMDCEGAEYEILLNCGRLGMVDYLCGELHVNGKLAEAGYTPGGLIRHCSQHIPLEHIHFYTQRMAD
jgi:FkbM family methyltransferase